ncbi:MAG: naringenin-chalcone synthase [Bdellovibrionaceae bacterium]|nr:naringenin-chalcone synthase [Pseudobdellovibrionaceae bacterium]
MNPNPVVLTDFQTILPLHHLDQASLIEWSAQRHGLIDGQRFEKIFHRYAVPSEKINERYFECVDALHSPSVVDESLRNQLMYQHSESHPEGAGIDQRAQFFQHRANQIFAEFYPAAIAAPDHLIHVTCTGYVAPSAAQMRARDWSQQTAVTHAYHMGCYAALPASRMALAFANTGDQNTRVDIVHTEMCSLHMNPANHTPEQMVVQSLFADGHVKYSAVSESKAKSGFRMLKFQEWILPDSSDDMSWVPAPWGMQMTLSREVPAKIAAHLRPFIQKLAQDSGQNVSELLKNSTFAVHPGGPKIIDSVRETLELSHEQVSVSQKILRERGNMSSATLPHIWKEILESNPKSGTKVVSLAFGPGLTMFGALFEII